MDSKWIDSKTISGCSDKNYYLYELKGVCFKLVATPHGRTPVIRHKRDIIALSMNNFNNYPTSERLKPPIPVSEKNRILYRFEYL